MARTLELMISESLMAWKKRHGKMEIELNLNVRGACDNVLPRTQRIIDECDWDSLKELVKGDFEEEDYRSRLDYVLVSVKPRQNTRCQWYYNGVKGPLIEQLAASTIKGLDRELVKEIKARAERKRDEILYRKILRGDR